MRVGLSDTSTQVDRFKADAEAWLENEEENYVGVSSDEQRRMIRPTYPDESVSKIQFLSTDEYRAGLTPGDWEMETMEELRVRHVGEK